jgi:hypothetical protein
MTVNRIITEAGKSIDADTGVFNKFDNAESVSDASSAVSEFILDWSTKNGIQKRVEKIQEPLASEIISLGERAFDEATNPILSFLKVYLREHDMTEDQFITLNNLWAHNIIGRNEMNNTGSGSPEQHCVIFNHTLWSQRPDDIEFIVRSYLWLGRISNLERYIDFKLILGESVGLNEKTFKHKDRNGRFDFKNKSLAIDAVNNGAVNPTKNGSDVIDCIYYELLVGVSKDDKFARRIRNAIIFVDCDEFGTVRMASDVERGLTALSEIAPKADEDGESVKDRANQTDATEESVNALFKDGEMTKDDFLKIYKVAGVKGWLK